MLSFQSVVLFSSICIACLTMAGVHASPYPDARREVSAPLHPMPQFRTYVNNPDFPDPKLADQRLRTAWIDMWHLAAIACVTLDDQEEVYQRYFEAGESEMVRYVFCNIAGIEDYTTCDLAKTEPIVNIHMQDLTIIAGRAQPDEVPEDEQPDLDDPDLVIFCTTFQDLGDNDEKAFTQFYKRSFDYPTISDIFTKRTCSGLGQYDSGLMTSLGAHMLHEMTHWRLLARADNNKDRFDIVIAHTVWLPDLENEDELEEVEHDFIDDYAKSDYQNPPATPKTGYGPVNTRLLVTNGNRASFQNADNYRWYAMSKYWSWRCTQANGGKKVVFQAQDDNNYDDGMIPEGCDGQVPCP